jgi:restriction system protein
MIPAFQEMMLPLLEFLKDGKEHTMDEAEDYLAKVFKLTEEERHAFYQNSNQRILHNSLGWARTWLNKAGLIDIIRYEHGQVATLKITQRGLDVLKEKPEKIDYEYLRKFKEFVEFMKTYGPKTNRKSAEDMNAKISDMTPEQLIEVKTNEINNVMREELMKKVTSSSPHFFEKLVLDLVVKMGYGGSFEDVAELLGKTGDEGVDGLIKEDVLGLDKVYLQAKRWTTGTVGRKELQSFVGALHGKGAKKGIFITTSTFTKDALEYANSLKDMTLILIDGDKLVDYMLKYNVGVQVKNAIEIKKIDEDYFDEY